jgi:hypothetical protein
VGAAAGYAFVAAEAGVAIYLANDLRQNTGAMLDPGGAGTTISEPAHNLTDYENPANYWDRFCEWYPWLCWGK